jgi:Pectate lyase superfamily protein
MHINPFPSMQAMTHDPSLDESAWRAIAAAAGLSAVDATNLSQFYSSTLSRLAAAELGGGPEPDVFAVTTFGADPTGTNDSRPGVQAAIDAAVARVAVTNRRAVLYFPSGRYVFPTKLGIRLFDIASRSKLSFVGTPGGASVLNMNGNAGGGDWYMFNVRDGSSFIEFKDLVLDLTGITNPDPAHQNHCIQIGQLCRDVRVVNCEFTNPIGDGIRLVGEFGQIVQDVFVNSCRFINCSRAGISFQRFVKNVTIIGCYFTGGADQQLDFEPTGYTLEADATGGTATTLIDAQATFQTWGIAAGDPLYNVSEQVLTEVVSVDSQTRLTTTTGSATWNAALYYFPLHNSGHIIVGNSFRRESGLDTLCTFSGSMGVVFADNFVQGCLQAQDMFHGLIANNRFWTRQSGSNATAVALIKNTIGTQIVNNDIWLRQTSFDIGRVGISVNHQQGRSPKAVTIAGNHIYAETRTIGINVESALNAIIKDNTIRLNTQGDTGKSGAISVRATISPMASVTISGNHISAMPGSGTWISGVTMDCNSQNIQSIAVGGGAVNDCTNPFIFAEGPGVFETPPVILPGTAEDGSTPIVPPASVPWVMLGGLGGKAGFTSSLHPGIYWGKGSPEGVLAAGIGSLALRADGGNHTALYIKESGTGKTGWVAK